MQTPMLKEHLKAFHLSISECQYLFRSHFRTRAMQGAEAAPQERHHSAQRTSSQSPAPEKPFFDFNISLILKPPSRYLQLLV